MPNLKLHSTDPTNEQISGQLFHGIEAITVKTFRIAAVRGRLIFSERRRWSKMKTRVEVMN